jgi:hypothetical protein
VKSVLTRAEQLADFLQDVALGEREASEREVYEAKAELIDQCLPDLTRPDVLCASTSAPGSWRQKPIPAPDEFSPTANYS